MKGTTLFLLLSAYVVFCFGQGSSLAYQVLDRHNAYRRTKGRSTLHCSSALMREAQHRADVTASRDPKRSIHVYSGSGLWHGMPTSGRRGAAENAYGYPRLDLDGIMTGWINSPGHHANMLNGNMNHIGVGVKQGASGWYYWVVIFGQYSATLPGCTRPGTATCATSTTSGLWGVNSAHNIYRWDQGWKKSCGKLKQVSASASYVWVSDSVIFV